MLDGRNFVVLTRDEVRTLLVALGVGDDAPRWRLAQLASVGVLDLVECLRDAVREENP